MVRPSICWPHSIAATQDDSDSIDMKMTGGRIQTGAVDAGAVTGDGAYDILGQYSDSGDIEIKLVCRGSGHIR